MVACAAVVPQPYVLLAKQMIPTLSVDQLKQQLLTALENNSHDQLSEAIADLEKAHITKDILEVSRVGAIVNDVRKKITEVYPDIARQLRNLIKTWQKLVEVRPNSNASSTNNTPSLQSPSAAKLARLATPVNRRVTSTGLTNGRSTTVSPAVSNGTIGDQSSPNGPAALHKSQSVGADLLNKMHDDTRNGKRKLEDVMAASSGLSTPSLKRTKTASGPLTPSGVSGTPSSVLAARRAAASTTELVAQLSQNLPKHMSIDSSIREHEEKVKREQHDEELAMQLYGGASTSSPYVQPERKKRKYERKIKPDSVVQSPSGAGPEERRGGLILRLPRLASVAKEADSYASDNSASTSSSYQNMTPQSAQLATEQPGTAELASGSSRKHDWLSVLPSLAELRIKADAAQKQKAERKAMDDPTKVYVVKVGERDVLALPYLEVSSEPDFLQYKYPEASQYYAEENFAYGTPRPV